MIYRIEAFDQKTELLVFEAQLPGGCDDQIAALEKLLGRTVFDPTYLFQLSCNVN